MRTKTYTLSCMAGMAALLTLTLLPSCVKDELYDTPHPGTARITVTADWSGRGEGLDIPSLWQLRMGGYSGEETGATHSPDCLFAPGEYILAGCISGLPGWLFTSVQQVSLDKDRDYELTAAMRQQVRQLTFIIEPVGDSAGRVEGIEARLSGVAGSLDFATDTHGTPSETALIFIKITDGADAGKWTSTVRLLGIAGAHPMLTGTIRFADGNPLPVTLESDLTEALAGFNSAKDTPLTLSGTVVETPAGAGFTASIDGWQQADAGNTDAH